MNGARSLARKPARAQTISFALLMFLECHALAYCALPFHPPTSRLNREWDGCKRSRSSRLAVTHNLFFLFTEKKHQQYSHILDSYIGLLRVALCVLHKHRIFISPRFSTPTSIYAFVCLDTRATQRSHISVRDMREYDASLCQSASEAWT